MSRQEFYNLFQEWPEDVLGQDWENELKEYGDAMSDDDKYGININAEKWVG